MSLIEFPASSTGIKSGMNQLGSGSVAGTKLGGD